MGGAPFLSFLAFDDTTKSFVLQQRKAAAGRLPLRG
jgi:hypothetical protein